MIKWDLGTSGLRGIIAILLLTIFTIFMVQNTNIVEIRFLFWEFRLSRFLLLAGSLITGILIGLILSWEMSSGRKK